MFLWGVHAVTEFLTEFIGELMKEALKYLIQRRHKKTRKTL